MSNSDKGFGSKSKEEAQETAHKGNHASGTSHATHSSQEKNTSHRKTSSKESQERSSGESSKHGKQGFASMSREKVQEIASKGGQASHKNR